MKSGGQLVVQSMDANGVDRIFCVPGESYLPVLDALVDAPQIDVVVCRQEGGAAMMADADARVTGRPGVCFVTRGPGATNASAGLHIAHQDSIPLVLFIGQIGSDVAEREAFQEIDYRRAFGTMAKWVAQIDRTDRIPEFVNRAFATAMSGRPGPVVLALPEDTLWGEADAIVPPPVPKTVQVPAADAMTAMADLLREAQRPFVIVGGGGWDEAGVAALRRFAEMWDVPVGTAFRCHDRLDNTTPWFVGDVGLGINPALKTAIQDSDVLIVVGARLGEATTNGYDLIDIPVPAQTLVHVHAVPEEVGRVYWPTLGIVASPTSFFEAAAALNAPEAPAWSAWRQAARDAYLTWSEPPVSPREPDMGAIVKVLRDHLPPGAIVTNGAGNYAIWPGRFYRYRQFRTLLGPTSGSMGFGVPAAVAAKLRHPNRPVVAFAGDGCFLMTGQEMATAAQYGAAIVVLVINNGMYGTIGMHQEREYPGRVSGTEIRNPDFAALARAYGGYGEIIEATADFVPAFERAIASGLPSILDIRMDPEDILPGRTISEMRSGP